MKTKKRDLKIDCVAMKRAVQAELAAETRGMTHAEEIAFYERAAAVGPMADYWKSIRGNRHAARRATELSAGTTAGGARNAVVATHPPTMRRSGRRTKRSR